nr:peptide chain release factor 2 [Carboxydothermus pertinax]
MRVSLDIPGKKEQVERLLAKTYEPGFWDYYQEAQKILKELNRLKDDIEKFEGLLKVKEELEVLNLLLEEEENEELAREAGTKAQELLEKLHRMEIALLLSGPYDKNSAIVSLHAGAGGTEAQDWVEMLYRMYTRWAEEKGYKVELIDRLLGDEAGLKSVTFSVEGFGAFGYLKAERGVHRLIRISPFDFSGRRHTSFASVDVLPEVEEDVPEIELKEEELKIETFRSGGAGGQHVNKTESAVRITHLPTGITVVCQNERSQLMNRALAEKLLKAKLLDLEMKKKEEELAKIRGEQKEIAWGSQIRTYVFHPYSLVKDHRTGVEVGDVQGVMDGEIDVFIEAYLKMLVAQGGSQ